MMAVSDLHFICFCYLTVISIVFWRDDKLRQISVPLTSQITVCVKSNFIEGKQDLQDCLAALVENVIDETILKTVNLSILMHTRSEDSRARTTALALAQALWHSNGGKLMGKYFQQCIATLLHCSNKLIQASLLKLQHSLRNVERMRTTWL